MKLARLCLVALAGAGTWGGSASAAILEDVPFNDVAGTAIEDATNVASGAQFSVDADNAGVVTNGSGQLNASLKSNTAFGSTLIDVVPDITSGQVWGVMELTWDFDAASLDAAENEEIRLTLISSGTSGVAAEFEIQREDDNTVTILGNGVGNTNDIPKVNLSMTQTQKFIGIIAVDLDLDLMEVYFSDDNGGSFTTLTGGDIDPAREVDKLRMVLNNDLSQDSVLIDRVYLTDMNPYPNLIATIPEPGTALLLGTGALAMIRRKR